MSAIKTPSLSSGTIALDIALGTKGWPFGHIVEIYSPQSAGKTSLCLSTVYQAQLIKLPTLYVDADNGIVRENFLRCNIKPNKITTKRPQSLEHAFEIIYKFLHAKKRSLVVIDSIASLLPKSYFTEVDRNHPEQDFRHRTLLERNLNMLQSITYSTASIVLITNRLTERQIMFGNPETTPWATLCLADIASIRVDIRRISSVKEKNSTSGQTVRAMIMKNRFFIPFKGATFNIMYDFGVDTVESIFSMATSLEIIKKTSGILKYKGNLLNNRKSGSFAALNKLRENPDLCEEVVNDIKTKIWQ